MGDFDIPVKRVGLVGQGRTGQTREGLETESDGSDGTVTEERRERGRDFDTAARRI